MSRMLGPNGSPFDSGDKSSMTIQVGMVQERGLVILKIGDKAYGFPVAQALLIARDLNNNALSILMPDGPSEFKRSDDEFKDDSNDLVL